MAKYSESLKLQIVQEYLTGPLGYNALAVKYDIKSKTQLQNWVALYKKYGKDGLVVSGTRNYYSPQFKLEVLAHMRQTGDSLAETAVKFGLKNPAIIATWNAAFVQGGVEALERPKGRPRKTSKQKTKQ